MCSVEKDFERKKNKYKEERFEVTVDNWNLTDLYLCLARDDSDEDHYAQRRAQNNHLQELQQLNAQINFSDMTPRERAYASSKQWKLVQAQRKLQRLMAGQHKQDAVGSSDYVLSSELFSHGSGARVSEQGAFSHLSGNVKCHKHYSQVALKAEKDIGSLSTIERFEFFYAFTKSGFREAMKLGRLPDGSDLKSVGRGKYKDKYGIVRDEHGPYWPPESGPLYPPPNVTRAVPSKTEPVLEHISGKCFYFSGRVLFY